MSEYVDSAIFIHTEEGASFIDPLRQNRQGVTISPVVHEELNQVQDDIFAKTDHIVIAGGMDFIKEMLRQAMEHDVSVGLIPLPNQKNLARRLSLPEKMDAQVEQALRKDAHAMDLILGNENIILFKASVGSIPLIDNPVTSNRLRNAWESAKMVRSLRLLAFTISANGEQETSIQTAACGAMIIQHHKRSLASRLIANDSSITDGLISLVLIAPFSVVDYGKFILQTLTRSEDDKNLPGSLGYIKSPEITIETEATLQVE